jgi:hypothetical protein
MRAVASSGSWAGSHPTPAAPVVPHTKVCAPAKPPVNTVRVIIEVGSAVVYGADSSGGWKPIAATPKVVAHSASGCVAIG